MTIVLFKSFLTTLLIYFSGLTFSGIFLNKERERIFFEQIFLGFIFLGFISLFFNFFIPLSKFFNTFYFFFVALISFFIFTKFKRKELLKNLFLIILVSVVSAILIFKSNIFRPDAGLYHLPYTKILNEEKIIIGLTNLHFRFGHVSILQYINSLNNNYINNEIGIVLPISILVSTFIFFLFFEIKKTNDSKDIFFQLFLILVLFFSISSLERYSDYGNDAAGYIFSILIIIYFFKFQNLDDKESFDKFSLLVLFSFFAFLNKSFLILFLIFPFVYFKINFFLSIIKNKIIIFSLFFVTLWFVKNIFVSGCIIYPSVPTCLDLLWSNLEDTKYYEISGEAASKGYLDLSKNEILLNQISTEQFSKNFNWLEIWFENHFFKILEKILPLIIFLLCIFSYKLFQHKENSNKISNKYYYLFFFSILGSIVWFLKFPLYRYGNTYLFLLITSSFIISFYIFKFKIFSKKEVQFMVSLFLIIFMFLNFNRIVRNYSLNSDFPNIYSMGKNINYKKRILNEGYYYLADSECLYGKNLCTHLEVSTDLVKKFGYKIFFKVN